MRNGDDRMDLETITLEPGEHETRQRGVCAMEAVAWLAGEPHTDHPACVCPAICDFVRAWNDDLPDNDSRNRLLRPLLPRLIGTTSTPEVATRRRWMACDWLVREHVPAWCDLTESLRPHAAALRGLPEVTAETIEQVVPASAAAMDAARDAAWSAAMDDAKDAAWGAARVAAMGAARDAVWGAAMDAAWGAAMAAAWGAAMGAARDAAMAAMRAGALGPTVKAIQQSAVALVERMIEAGAAE